MTNSSKQNETPAEYAVGRGKPPKHSQFKPGQSGNPGGRKKGSVNVKSAIRLAMETAVDVSENGRKRSVSMLDALILNLAQQGLRGNVKAMQLTLALAERYCDADNDDREELPDEDYAILERLSRRRGPGRGGSGHACDDQSPAGARRGPACTGPDDGDGGDCD